MAHVRLGLPALALGLGLSACTGVLGGPSSNQASNAAGSSSTLGGSANVAGNAATAGTGVGTGGTPGGNPDTGSPIQAAPTWRLTNLEYASTVKDLLGVAVTTPLDPDGAMAGYRAGLVAGDATVQAYYDAALAAAAAVNVQQLAPCDAAAVTAGGADCAAKFIDAVGPKAFRRPLDADTRAGL